MCKQVNVARTRLSDLFGLLHTATLQPTGQMSLTVRLQLI